METVGLLERAPGFDSLPGADGRVYSLSSFDDAPVLVVVFVGNGCPSVESLEPWMIQFQNEYEERGTRVVWVNSNNASLSPSDTLEEVSRRAESSALPFPYLKDERGDVARAFGAVSTPHAFVLDQERKVRYRGRVADSRQSSGITEPYVKHAVDDVLGGREVRVAETEPYGCSITW